LIFAFFAFVQVSISDAFAAGIAVTTVGFHNNHERYTSVLMNYGMGAGKRSAEGEANQEVLIRSEHGKSRSRKEAAFKSETT
jgi:hypothetical protein